jgi:hypothetical protein
VQFVRGLLPGALEPAIDPRLQLRHEDVVAEPLPTLLGVVDGEDRLAAGLGYYV